MNKLKSIWLSITGSVSSIIPLLFACCKSGACVGVCASPVASLFGISTAGLATSPLINVIEPILIALSAVSFTISYYSLYVIPRFNSCKTDCDCAPSPDKIKKEKISKGIFWIGLLASIFFFTYFEVQKYQANQNASLIEKTECCAPGAGLVDSVNLKAIADTSKPCCESGAKCE